MLLSKLRACASITIGVNLDASLRPIQATLLSVNKEPFTDQSLLNKLFGIRRDCAIAFCSTENSTGPVRYSHCLRLGLGNGTNDGALVRGFGKSAGKNNHPDSRAAQSVCRGSRPVIHRPAPKLDLLPGCRTIYPALPKARTAHVQASHCPVSTAFMYCERLLQRPSCFETFRNRGWKRTSGHN